MTNIQRNEIILSNINKNLPESSNARVAWIAIDSAVPEERYELFQSAAESVLNRRWECEDMKRWALKTGEF